LILITANWRTQSRRRHKQADTPHTAAGYGTNIRTAARGQRERERKRQRKTFLSTAEGVEVVLEVVRVQFSPHEYQRVVYLVRVNDLTRNEHCPYFDAHHPRAERERERNLFQYVSLEMLYVL
jgi:hypothetical protein